MSAEDVNRISSILNGGEPGLSSSDNGAKYAYNGQDPESLDERATTGDNKRSIKEIINTINDYYSRLFDLIKTTKDGKSLIKLPGTQDTYKTIVKNFINFINNTKISGKGKYQWYRGLIIPNGAINQGVKRKLHHVDPFMFHVLINDIIPGVNQDVREKIISVVRNVRPNNLFLRYKNDQDRAIKILQSGPLVDFMKAYTGSLKDDNLMIGHVKDKADKPKEPKPKHEEDKPEEFIIEETPEEPNAAGQSHSTTSADQGEEDINEVEPTEEEPSHTTANIDSLMTTPAAVDNRAPISDIEESTSEAFIESAFNNKPTMLIANGNTYQIDSDVIKSAIEETGLPEAFNNISKKQENTQADINKFRNSLMETINKLFKEELQYAEADKEFNFKARRLPLNVPRPRFSRIYSIGRMDKFIMNSRDRTASAQGGALRVNPLIFKHAN